ncbi:MAG: NfeD family protein [Acidimicrobiales bacterium]|jgi:membrane-bound ClpP family serine protease
MWVIAGVLLGLVVLASLIGFHVGPHAHVAAGIFGVLAAAWLVAMAVDGRSAPVLWALLSADVVVSAGIATLAWKGLTTRSDYVAGRQLVSLDGAEGFAVGGLDPDGIVRVNGENWSALSVNGPVRAGAPVQVVGVKGVRLEVWGDESTALGPDNELEATIPPDADANDAAPSSHTEVTNEGGGS